MPLVTTARNATLADLAAILKAQHSRKIDIVLSATALRSEGGLVRVAGAEPVLDEDGVTASDGIYRPTDIFDGHLAEKLGIPVKYLRRMRAERPDLLDANVNGWLHGDEAQPEDADGRVDRGPDARTFLFRGFTGDEGEHGYARALLSDRFGILDNLDALIAVLAGVKQAGVPVEIDTCDLTDRRMYVKIAAPAVEALAPVLLDGYRRPWGPGAAPWETAAGRAHGWLAPDERPVVFAGFAIGNSETGDGAFSITPQVIVKACKNGLTFTSDALRAVHLGGKMEEGIVRWTADTQRKQLDLITAKARDAVATFLDVEYVKTKVAELERTAGTPLAEPAKAIEIIGKRLAFSEETIAGVLDAFVRGGQVTAGGVCQAITAHAQTVADADTAYELEAAAVGAMQLAAREFAAV